MFFSFARCRIVTRSPDAILLRTRSQSSFCTVEFIRVSEVRVADGVVTVVSVLFMWVFYHFLGKKSSPILGN
jgi:hypothetical protein